MELKEAKIAKRAKPRPFGGSIVNSGTANLLLYIVAADGTLLSEIKDGPDSSFEVVRPFNIEYVNILSGDFIGSWQQGGSREPQGARLKDESDESKDFNTKYEREQERLKNLMDCLKSANKEYIDKMNEIYKTNREKFNQAAQEMNPFTKLNLAENAAGAGLGLGYEKYTTGHISLRGGLIGFGFSLAGKALVNLGRANYYALYPEVMRHHVYGPKLHEKHNECHRKYGW